MSITEPITDDWMMALLAMIDDAYPFTVQGPEERRRRCATWRESLDDLHRSDVAEAVRQWLAANPKPPALSDVRKAAQALAKRKRDAERLHGFMGHETTFRCAHCKDTGFIEMDDQATTVKRCNACQPSEVLRRWDEIVNTAKDWHR